MTDRLLTVQEASERLRLRESTIRAWMFLGKLPRVQLSGRAVRIPSSAVESIIEKCTSTASNRDWRKK